MASDIANRVSYFLSLPAAHKNYLGGIRHWDNLKMGMEDEVVWVKDLTLVQIESIEIKSIPHKTLYYANGSLLYKQGSLLPDRALPSLLWTPIERALSVQLPPFNHHFFGLNQKVGIALQQTEEEQEAYACMVAIEDLHAFVETAAAVRLKPIQWVIVNDRALLLGTPLLPVQGDVFWRLNDFLLPAGHNFELPLLSGTLQQMLNPEGDHWILWQQDGAYCKLTKEDFRPLSIASFRQTTRV